jgi:hypothetical protein
MTRLKPWRSVAVSAVAVWCMAGTQAVTSSGKQFTPQARLDAIRRAQVWMPTEIPSMDLKVGPAGPDAFAPDEKVTCDHVKHARGNGFTPKFWCAVTPEDIVKVRYREHNGKVYAQVAGTRLFWALGFGADRAYPVKVACRGCPFDPWASPEKPDSTPVVLFDPATIDRKMPGKRLETRPDEGWAWRELDLVDEAAGGAPLAQRDALKLLAVFVQHTDTKPSNQELMCLDKQFAKVDKKKVDKADKDVADADVPEAAELDKAKLDKRECAHPFLMVPDLGTTFGHANTFNRDAPGRVNFKNWSETPIWRDKEKEKGNCIGNLPGSVTGTIDNPRISEAGRKFLADLLVQLSDAQLHDLFDVARFTRRDPSATTDNWVQVFKQKRDEIVNRTCSS